MVFLQFHLICLAIVLLLLSLGGHPIRALQKTLPARGVPLVACFAVIVLVPELILFIFLLIVCLDLLNSLLE